MLRHTELPCALSTIIASQAQIRLYPVHHQSESLWQCAAEFRHGIFFQVFVFCNAVEAMLRLSVLAWTPSDAPLLSFCDVSITGESLAVWFYQARNILDDATRRQVHQGLSSCNGAETAQYIEHVKTLKVWKLR
jgi:hypothetical protein